VSVLAKRGRIDLTIPIRLRHWLLREGIDVLHAFLPASCLYGYLATRRWPRHGHRPALIAAERSELRGAPRWERVIKRWVYPRSDAVTANAGPVALEIERRLGVLPGRTYYVPNGIDLEDWDRRGLEDTPLELSRELLHLALVGGLRRHKNHLVLLDALSRIPLEERGSWRIWFIGDATSEREHAERIRWAIARNDLASVVRIVSATPHIASVMRRLSALCLPSSAEGFPNVLLEAMASRLPVIASRVGDIPNIIEDGVAGILVQPGDVDGLTHALRRLFRSTEAERAAMGSRARAVVEERYRMQDVAQRYARIYSSVATGRP